MPTANPQAIPTADPAAAARFHTVLRFAAGTTAAFVLCEAMGWYPSFLAPLFTAMLLASLPVALPAKAGLALVLVEAGGAYAAFILASWLHEAPLVQFGVVALVLFVCFATLARGRGFLPILLTLVSFATIPVATMVAPQQAAALPLAFARSMAIAVVIVWAAHALWPRTLKGPPPAPKMQFASPLALAVVGTAIVIPLMLAYLMYGITDALPLLITTVVLVINFDPGRGATQATAMMIGNFIGGLAAVVAVASLEVAPSLTSLCLIAFLIGIGFASRIVRGGPAGAVGLVTFNQTVVMFGLALVPGGAEPGLWLTRLTQFALASLFAVGLMTLLLPRQDHPAVTPQETAQ